MYTLCKDNTKLYQEVDEWNHSSGFYSPSLRNITKRSHQYLAVLKYEL